ncbi:MAG TPA: pyridoxal phosphate-dependent aminotransferase [Dongiaceae bacterium]|nr:pyridoxal phosphate-dependent aminotransferase [Dongiaceae bacterium]
MPEQLTVSGLRDAILNLPTPQITGIANYGRGRQGVIPLWFGESDQPTPSFICDAAAASLRQGFTHYTPKRGIPELRGALSVYMEGLYGKPIDVDRITVTTSAMNAIMMILQAVADPGSNVVFVTPLWSNPQAAAAIIGAEPREVPLDADADAQRFLDIEKLLARVDDKTVALFVNTPNNPTGWMMEREQMRELVAFCRKRGIWLIADEVYCRLVFDRKVAPSFLEVSEAEDRLVVINSFSKTWSMTGWRLGWLTTPADIGPSLEAINEYNTSGATSFVQAAGVTAVREGEPFIRQSVDLLRENRDLVYKMLSGVRRIRLPLPRATFYAFFAVDSELDSLSLARHLIDEAGVGLAPGSAFGAGGEGSLRLCFASQRATVEEASRRLAKAFS